MTHGWVGVVAAIVGLGIMILVHEWGHYIVARWCGVRVEVFSIGFGTRIFGWKRGDTDFRLAAFPFGGYVKMAGENPAEDRAGAPDELLSKSRWQRFLIVVAGPVMNIVLAIVMMWGLYMIGVPVPKFAHQAADVAGVVPDSPAAKAGILPGDKIVEVNDTNVSTWEQVISNSGISAGKEVSLEVERAGRRIPIKVDVPKNVFDPYEVTGYPHVSIVLVDSVAPGFPAAQAGLQVGDQILSVNGELNPNWNAAVAIIRDSDGKPVSIEFRRNGKTISKVIQPKYEDPGDGGGKRWVIGAVFAPGDTVRRSLSVSEAAVQSWSDNVGNVKMVVTVFAGLFSGRFSLKQMAGPIGIVSMSTQAAKMGMADFIAFMALLSVNLGIVNLLPIPILDGGRILVMAIEGSIRRDLSVRVQERLLTAGLVFILAVFGFVMYYDIARLFPNH